MKSATILRSITIIVLLGLYSTTYAAIHADVIYQGLPIDKIFVGKIVAADYSFKNKDPKMTISLRKSPNEQIAISFTGKDIPFAMALVNFMGKTVTVGFKNSSYDVNDLFIDGYQRN